MILAGLVWKAGVGDVATGLLQLRRLSSGFLRDENGGIGARILKAGAFGVLPLELASPDKLPQGFRPGLTCFSPLRGQDPTKVQGSTF